LLKLKPKTKLYISIDDQLDKLITTLGVLKAVIFRVGQILGDADKLDELEVLKIQQNEMLVDKGKIFAVLDTLRDQFLEVDDRGLDKKVVLP